MSNGMFDIMFIIVPIFIGVVFIFTFAMIISPKLRGKIMSRQIKATKYMMDNSKEDLESIGTTAGNVSVNVRKNVLDANEDVMRDMATREANINKEAVETTARAIRDGFVGDSIYCKYCGSKIDEDSKFCKKCGKEM